ncbi:MAG: GLPGLI family protein [Bacteroidota bacterium]
MKISTSIILFLSLFFIQESKSQNSGSITYTVERLERYTNPRISKRKPDGTLKRKFKFDSISKANLDGKESLFQLDFNSNFYHFYYSNETKKDDAEMKDILKRSLLTGIKDFFYDLENENVLFRYNTEGTDHLLERNLFSSEKWHVTDETKEILGYTCKKAIFVISFEAEYETIVWFTEEVPVDFGPLGYFGLGGAVLGLELNHCWVEAKSIDYESQPEIELPEIPLLSYEEHRALISKDSEN